MRKLGETHSEGFSAEISEDADGRVFFKGDLDIDADGANGQHGQQPAYAAFDTGSELLENGGMGMSKGRVVGIASWWRDIVYIGPDGEPLMLPNGVVPSATAYKFPGNSKAPENQVDAETVPYIVVPSMIIEKVAGAVKGCKAAATYRGRRVFGMVGDVGPRSKVGEASIEMARLLGIRHSPRNGGVDEADVLFELWPGVPAEIHGKPIPLMRANGTWITA